MAKTNGADAPWKSRTFRQYLQENEFPSWLFDVAVLCLIEKRELDVTVMKQMNEEFRKYMDGDYSYASIARMITAQGYETVNDANTLIRTYLNGRPTEISLTPSDIPSTNGRKRAIAFGAWNVFRKNGVEYYPFFTAGIIAAIDPFFTKTQDD